MKSGLKERKVIIVVLASTFVAVACVNLLTHRHKHTYVNTEHSVAQ